MNTKYFGEIPIEKKDIIYFPDGIFGFETSKDFLLLPFSEEEDSLLCMQSADEPEIAFILMNPYFILPDYHPQIDLEILHSIGMETFTNHAVYCIVVVHENFLHSTVNLKCPIIINVEKKLAKQVILEDSHYSLRHPISSDEKKEV